MQRKNSTEFITLEQTEFNPRQIVLLILGTLFWILFTADAYGLIPRE